MNIGGVDEACKSNGRSCLTAFGTEFTNFQWSNFQTKRFRNWKL